MLKSGLALAMAVVCASVAVADFDERPEVRDYIEEVAAQHGFDQAALLSLFRSAERKSSILAAISRPAERKPWHEYRRIFVTPTRISGGNRVLARERRHAAPRGAPLQPATGSHRRHRRRRNPIRSQTSARSESLIRSRPWPSTIRHGRPSFAASSPSSCCWPAKNASIRWP